MPAALLALAGLAAPAAAQHIDTLGMRAHTYFLSSDLLQGRGTGTRGAHLAAAYLASELRRLGLQGVGPGGAYLLPVPLQAADVNDATTTLSVAVGADTLVFHSGINFVLNTGARAAFHDIAGPALFVGTAAQADGALEGRSDVAGSVLVVAGTLGADAATLIPDWIRRGVAGVILVVPDADRFRLLADSRGGARMFLDGAGMDDPVWQPALPEMVAGPDVARALLAGAPLDETMVDGHSRIRALPLARSVTTHVVVSFRRVDAANVAALLPGRDPALSHQVVVYTAHYDHLGIGAPDQSGDSIFNGFSDNAAGDAMLLAIAEAMKTSPPARSVLFLFPTGEERGLLGSTAYAAAPAIPLARTVAVINLDAGAPPAPPLDWRIAGGTASSLGAEAVRIAKAHGWTATSSPPSPNSDYWPFLARGVPSAFIIPGPDWEGVGAAEKARLDARWEHYHQRGDEWKPDFPFVGLARYARLALELGMHVADAPARPKLLSAGR